MGNYRVFETLSAWGLMTVGERYGLSPVDLWKANARVNQAQSVSATSNGKGRHGETKKSAEMPEFPKNNQSGCKFSLLASR